jgi:ribosomal protein S1
MILRLDPDRGKVSLGLRQVLPDPWSQIPGRYHIGETTQVTVSRLVRNGAFVRLQEGVEAFIPISELSHKRIRRPEDVVSVGQTVEALVTEIKPDQRRMVMSLRALQEEAERKQVERHVRRSEPKSTGFTIADRLQGQLGDFLRPGDETGTPSENEHSENTTENEHSDHTTNEVAEEVNEKETETAGTEGGVSTDGG